MSKEIKDLMKRLNVGFVEVDGNEEGVKYAYDLIVNQLMLMYDF